MFSTYQGLPLESRSDRLSAATSLFCFRSEDQIFMGFMNIQFNKCVTVVNIKFMQISIPEQYFQDKVQKIQQTLL